VIAALMLGFAAYQIWGTGVITNHHQESLATDFEELQQMAAAGNTPVRTLPSAAPTSTAPAVLSQWDNPVIAVGEGAEPETFARPTEAFDDPSPGTIVQAPRIVQEVAPSSGEVLGRIVIDGIDLDWMIVEGVGAGDLSKGPGHMPRTPIPGQAGNSVISGHRTTNGAPFLHLDRLEAGDSITVETLIGTHVYEVVGSRIVEPTGIWVTKQWEGSWLTLTTCNPLYSSRERLIVFAKLVDGPNDEAIHDRFPSAYELPEPPTS
jgi:sortase A